MSTDLLDPAGKPKHGKPGEGRPGEGKPGGKLQKWVETHKAQAALGAGAVGVVGIAVYRRGHGDSSASDNSSGAVPNAATTGAGGGYLGDSGTAGGVAYDPASDNANAIGALSDLSDSVAALSNSDAAGLAAVGKLVAKNTKAVKHAAKRAAHRPAPKRRGVLGGKKPTQGPVKRVNHPAKKPVKHKGKK